MDFSNINQETLTIGLLVLLCGIMFAAIFIANLNVLHKNAHIADISSQAEEQAEEFEKEIKRLTEKHSDEVKNLNRKILKCSIGNNLKLHNSNADGIVMDMDIISGMTKMAITFGYSKGCDDAAKGAQVSSEDSAEHYYDEFISELVK
ncbi:hypothetical protein QXB71_003590 [Vibrio cholerae]|nr:hypothetical protein [Vibrio cholerae]